MTMLVELGEWLEDQAVGTVGTNLFLGRLPDTPDAATALFEYAGAAPFHTMGPTVVWERPRLQVLCRAADYATARSQAETIYQLLDVVAETTIESVRYHQIEALQSPFLVQRDANDRPVIGCNYEVWRDVT